MTSKKTDDDNSPENTPENNPGADDQSPEAIAAAAIAAAKAGAVDEDSATDEAAENQDPLDFDQDRMPDADAAEVDLSEDASSDESEDHEAALAAANAKADENWNRVLLVQADLENERKRAQKQVANAHKFAIEGLVNELLPIKDSLEMGLEAAKGDDADLAKIVEGSELTLKLMAQAFEKFNISDVDPLDEKFDPTYHQAMSMQEAEGKDPNTVIGVMQKGYTLNDRLRPALVTVSK